MNNQRQILLGIFFIGALSILAFYTLFLTDIHLFSKPILMTVYFPDANGLREGDPVQFLGARIGRVRELTPDGTAETRRRIRTVLSLDREVELLENATITIRESSFLGGRHVFIDPGTFGGPQLKAEEDGSYYGTVFKNPIAMLGDLGQILNENREAISKSIQNIEAFTANLRDGKGLLGQLVSDPAMADDARRILANVGDATDNMRAGQGLMGALFYDPALKESVTATLDRVEKIGADLENQTGVLGSMIYDSALRDKLKSGVDSLVAFGEKLNSAEGTVHMLLSDTETRDQVKTVIANFTQTSEDVRAVMADLRDGKGTLGKLFSEDGLYDEFQRAVALLTRSLEDYREAAPITTFTSVLFAGF